MPSQHQQRKANIARKRHNRSLGICVNDGLPVAQNLDGTNSVFCEDCKADYVLRTATHRKPVRADVDNDALERREWAMVLAYAAKIEKVIRRADANGGENYKGITIAEIHRLLGEDIDRNRTARAMNHLTLFESNLTPERYSLMTPAVRYVGHEKWGTAVDPRGYQFNSRYSAQAAIYGKRERG